MLAWCGVPLSVVSGFQDGNEGAGILLTVAPFFRQLHLGRVRFALSVSLCVCNAPVVAQAAGPMRGGQTKQQLQAIVMMAPSGRP